MYSVTAKSGYLDHFFTKRILRGILLEAYLVYALSVIVNICRTQEIPQLIDLIDPRRFLSQTNWYIGELLIFYLWFYFSVKFWRSKILVSTAIFSVFLAVVMFVSGMSIPWYGSTLCFALGICFFEIRDKDPADGAFDDRHYDPVVLCAGQRQHCRKSHSTKHRFRCFYGILLLSAGQNTDRKRSIILAG